MKTIFTIILFNLIVIGGWAQQKSTFQQESSFTNNGEKQIFSISKIYPNPAKDIVNLDIKAVNPEDLKISLYNILGVEVKVWGQFYIPSGGQIVNLDLSEFKSGVYIIKLTNGTRVCSQVIRKS